jgi:hypothetical protein
MRYSKFFVAAFTALILTGCASFNCKHNTGSVLQGTDTAIVGLYIDKNGYPQTDVDIITVRPGQKIVFTGPDRFEIFFKNQQSPIDKLEVQSSNGIIAIEIPKNIFERQRTTNISVKEIIYRYGIRANGKVTDPSIRVER